MISAQTISAQTALIAALLAPIALLAACLSRRLRERMPALLAFAPMPALAAALSTPGSAPLVLFPPPFRMTLTLDTAAAMLLGAAALLWIIAGAYAASYLRGQPNAGRFCEWWLLTLSGSIGVFMAADLVSFYLTYSVVSLAAWGLVVHDGTAASRRAGAVYLALAVLGEAFLLMAFVFMAQSVPDGSLLIRDAVAALPASPWREASLALLLLGFGLKIGLVPGHGWMPLAYRSAPIPAAALSGAAVKAGVIGLIRFLPLGVAMPGWGEALAAAGLLSAFYGVAIGITQENPKTVLAYSSVSQMGLLAAALGMGWAVGDASPALATSFSATNHILVKGGLFLAIGVAAAARPRRWPVLVPAAVLALGLGGLPLTGGGLAKLALKTELGEGLIGVLATLSAAASTLLMLHFLRRLTARETAGAAASAPCGLVWPWLAIAFATIAVPWALFPLARSGSRAAALAPAALGTALWPVLAGGVFAAVLWRSGFRLPSIAEGDIIVAGERWVGAAAAWGRAVETADNWLREWPSATLALLLIAMALAALVASR